jgi:DNA-binding NarL/FixJ family response regulator
MVHLFVAEDTKLIKKFLKYFIEEHASEVIRSTDNCGTVDEFRQDSSKVTFLDIQLPDETGLDSVYDIVNSIPEARIDVYKTDLKDHVNTSHTEQAEVIEKAQKPVQQTVIRKSDVDKILEMGIESAIKSTTQMLNKDLKFNIIQENVVKKNNISQVVPRTCLGVFYKIGGDIDGGTSLIFPLHDVLSMVSVFQIDFTVEEGTTQNIINELGNIFINNILSIIDEQIRKKSSLGVPIPVNGDNLEQQLLDVGKEKDDCMVLKFEFLVDNQNIESFLVLSIGRIIS